jgi:ABC-type transporter Mla subunit MlaD
MKFPREQTIYVALILLLLFIIALMYNGNRKSVSKVELKIDTLALEMKRMNELTRLVSGNLQTTIELINGVSDELDRSSTQLRGLLLEAGHITAQEKDKIRAALAGIENTRKSVEEEKKRAQQLIEELHQSD